MLEKRSAGYAVRYKGMLRVPTEGLYVLRARIDGAYRLLINGDEVLLRDGQYGACEQASIAGFSKGDQRFELTHLFDAFPGMMFWPVNLPTRRRLDPSAIVA